MTPDILRTNDVELEVLLIETKKYIDIGLTYDENLPFSVRVEPLYKEKIPNLYQRIL